MGRSPCCSKAGLNRGAWTAHEDKVLTEYIKAHGEGRWRNLPKRAGLRRCGKSCRLRWLNYLRPDIKRGNISSDEEELIIRLHKLLGNRWSLIAGRLPGRTDNEIKNYWNTNLGKKVQDRQKSAKKEAEKTPTSGISSAHVVRTRAIRCSKVFINPQPPKMIEPSDRNREEAKLQPSINGDGRQTSNQTSTSTKINIENNEDNVVHNKNNYSSDFMLDFNLGEFCLSDLLNSDFANLGDLNYSNDSCNALSPSTSEQGPLIFTEEMFHDWTSSCSQQNVASNQLHPNQLHPLASLLDCGEEWLTD